MRPAQPDPEPLRTITLPADLYNPDGACKEHLYFGGPAAPDSLGKAWFQHREKYWEQEWIRIYFILSNELHSCCIRQFNECQRKVLYGAPGPTPEQVALEACVRQFSPEHQPRIALQGAPAAARTAEVERQSLEQQYGVCRKERSQCQTRLNELEKGQQALGKRALAGEALTTDLGACKTNLAALQNEFTDLRDAFQQVGLHRWARV